MYVQRTVTRHINFPLQGWATFLIIALLFEAAWLCFRSKPNLRLPTGNRHPAVALGDSHGVILASDGSLWVWGEEDSGWPVLGLGNIHRQSSLHRVGTNNDWVDVAAGVSHTLALKADGTVWGWGENHTWQLGDGTRTARSTPVRAISGNDWKQIATGQHGLALRKDGSLWAWGDNWSGVLGDGSTRSSPVPVQVGNSTNWAKVWANNIESVGLQSDGSLWYWGQLLLQFGPKGQIITSPTRLSDDTNWVDVGLGDFMGFAIKSDGTLWAWGADADIYTGAPNPTMNGTPRQVGIDHDWRACAPFWNSCTLLMKQDGSLWALDDLLEQRSQRLGNPAWRMKPVVPRRIPLNQTIVAFAGGKHHLGVALTRDGEVWTWGWALGQRSAVDAAAETLSGLLAHAGIRNAFGRNRPGPISPIVRSEPWRLANVPQ